MEKRHSRCRKSVENFTAQQKMEKRRSHCRKSVENFTAQQKIKKSQFYGKNWRNVPSIVEMENNLQCCPLDFGHNVRAQIDSGRMGSWSPFHEASSPTSFL